MSGYKETLNLPTTTFPMKGKLSENEPKKYQEWISVWQSMRCNRTSSAATFVLHDGPPYANGSIHIGHALNKILKDFVVKWHYFNGYQVTFKPGWDCHGLPIEREVKKILRKGINKKMAEAGHKGFDLRGVASHVLRAACRDYAFKHVELQTQEFQSLGVVADWNNIYMTMDYGYEASIYRNFYQLFLDGYIVERQKPVYWSIPERTALAEAEVEYQDQIVKSIYVGFDFSSQTPLEVDGQKVNGVMVWTTTPWTLPANVAVAANPNAGYVVAEVPDMGIVAPGGAKPSKFYLISTECVSWLETLREDPSDNRFKPIIVTDKKIKGEKLAGLKVHSPLQTDLRPIVFDEQVEKDTGTGFVHIAPGHGEWDYEIGQRENLPTVMPVGEDGCYTTEVVALIDLIKFEGRKTPQGAKEKRAEEYVGVNVFDANDMLVMDLDQKHSLICWDTIHHDYPHCWRSKTPVIFRSTLQWFLDISKVREKALQSLRNVHFYPERDKARLEKMVEERPEWCLSRQREWGVPIALFRHKETGEILAEKQVFEHIEAIFAKYGCDCWWTAPNSYFFPPNLLDQADSYEKVTDILDVWFDSGLSWDNADLPIGGADVYLEGNDQHRGWFQSSLWTGVALTGRAPYNAVVTHGFVVDGKGKKMAKSEGNVISPMDVVSKYGAEVLRTWVAMTDYKKEVSVNDNILRHTADIYQKIRNTFRYMLQNLDGDNPPCVCILKTDEWIINKVCDVTEEANRHFAQYDFQRGMHLLIDFITTDLSSIYMYAAKDRLYCDKEDSARRRSAQTALYSVLIRLRNTLAPILTYTMDEVAEHAPKWFAFKESIFNMPHSEFGVHKQRSRYFNAEKEEYWKKVRDAFNMAFASLKNQGTAKEPLDVVIGENAMTKEFGECEDWLGVSRIVTLDKEYLIGAFMVDDLEFYIYRSNKPKCERCWKRNAYEQSMLCERCELATDVRMQSNRKKVKNSISLT